MHTIDNMKYFTRTVKDKAACIRYGIAGLFLVIAAVLFFVRIFDNWLIQNTLFSACIFAAVATVASVFAGQTKGSVLDAYVRQTAKEFESEAESFFFPEGTVQKMKISEERKKHCTPYAFTSYIYGDDSLLYRKGGDKVMRSSRCSYASVRLFRDEIAVGMLHFSVTDASDRDKTAKLLPYASLENAELCTPSLPIAQRSATVYTEIVLHGEDGTQCVRIPAVGDSDTDLFVEELNRRIAHAKEKRSRE